jgi:hypothetical protein
MSERFPTPGALYESEVRSVSLERESRPDGQTEANNGGERRV